MGIQELNSLAMILPILQKSILSLEGEKISLLPQEMINSLSQNFQNPKETLQKILLGLGGLRFQSSWDGQIVTSALFKQEVWKKNKEGKQELELELGEQGAELILGYRDPYQSVQRYLRGNQRGLSTARSFAQKPLMLWKSPWLDFTGIEQNLFLQLEKKMQRAENWLSLDGFFEADLDELFAGMGRSSNKSEDSDFIKQLRIVAKLGYKLLDHGLFVSGEESGQLDYGEASTGLPQLSWKVSAERFLENSDLEYRRNVATYFAAEYLKSPSEDSFSYLMPGVSVVKRRSYLREMIPRIMEICSNNTNERVKPLSLQGNALISIPQLFIEWNLRLLAGNKFEIPASLIESEAVKILSRDPHLPLEERYRKFSSEIDQNSSYELELKNTPFATVVSDVTLAVKGVQSWLDSCRPEANGGVGKLHLAKNSPKLVYAQADKKAVSVEKSLSNEKRPEKKPSTISGERLSKRKLIADQELTKIRSVYPARYQELKLNYLRSLADEQKKMILDVEERMQMTDFDKHLKPHLINYMIKHPGSWSSAQISGSIH
jgi:hypothetical protein